MNKYIISLAVVSLFLGGSVSAEEGRATQGSSVSAPTASRSEGGRGNGNSPVVPTDLNKQAGGGGSPMFVVNVWGKNRRELPHIRSGEQGCPSWMPEGCTDIRSTEYFRARMAK